LHSPHSFTSLHFHSPLCSYDLLLRYRLHIVGETSLAINHCLVALPGTKIENIKRVMSHPQVCACLKGGGVR